MTLQIQESYQIMELPEQTNLVKKKDTKRKRGYLGSTELNMNA